MWIQNVAGGGVTALVYSSNGRTLFTFDAGGWLTAWDVTTRTKRRVRVGIPEWGEVQMVRPTREPGYLALMGDGALVWNLESDLPNLNLSLKYRECSLGPDGEHIVALGEDAQSICSWHIGTQCPGPVFARWTTTESVGCFALSPTEPLVAVSVGTGYLILIRDGVDAPPVRLPHPEQDGWFHKIAFSPDGNTLACVSWSHVTLWDVADQRPRVRIIPSNTSRNRFAFHPTVPLFAAMNAENVLTQFSLETGEPIRSLDFALGRYVTCVAFSPDGLTCAVGGSNKQFVVFDVDL
jgi:WD40 repeat protein